MSADERTDNSGLRVLSTDLADPRYTVICDECILLARAEGLVPDTLHLYRRSHPSISLGHFQVEKECVDLELMTERGVELVRRVSGGSAVYTDPGQWVYSLVLSDNALPESPISSYPVVCAGVVEGLRELGIEAYWKSLNDVEVRGRKISGSAQTRKKGAVMQHGTLIIDTDLELITSLLRPIPGKPHRGPQGLTSIRAELGRWIDAEEVKYALVQGFSKALNLRPYYSSLSDWEKRKMAPLNRERYLQAHGLG